MADSVYTHWPFRSAFVASTPLTFEEELFSHRLGFILVQVYHGHLRASLPQGMGESAAYALPSTRHVGHLSIETHPIEDRLPLDPAENFVVCYFTLYEK